MTEVLQLECALHSQLPPVYSLTGSIGGSGCQSWGSRAARAMTGRGNGRC